MPIHLSVCHFHLIYFQQKLWSHSPLFLCIQVLLVLSLEYTQNSSVLMLLAPLQYAGPHLHCSWVSTAASSLAFLLLFMCSTYIALSTVARARLSELDWSFHATPAQTLLCLRIFGLSFQCLQDLALWFQADLSLFSCLFPLCFDWPHWLILTWALQGHVCFKAFSSAVLCLLPLIIVDLCPSSLFKCSLSQDLPNELKCPFLLTPDTRALYSLFKCFLYVT